MVKVPLRMFTFSGWAVAIFLAGYVLASGSQDKSETTINQMPNVSSVPERAVGEATELKVAAALPMPASGSPGKGQLAFGSGFEFHPASAFFGKIAPLRLTPDQRNFQTRFREAYQSPVNFGGSLVILQFGCGTGCSFAYALDKSSGLVLDFPIGGEAYQGMGIHAEADSALVWASWYTSPSFEECQAQAWKLGANGFVDLTGVISISCEMKDQLPTI